MKRFKFLSNKPLFNPDLYEEMVLGMVYYCHSNMRSCIDYVHHFTMTEQNVSYRRRIVIKDIIRTQEIRNDTLWISDVRIVYELHLIHDHMEDAITLRTFTIPYNEYMNLMEMITRQN